MSVVLGGYPTPAHLTVGASQTPGRFPMVPGTYDATGIHIPGTSLDRWFAARATSAASLVVVTVYGDSTWAGQTLTGTNYSPMTRLRALLAADGYVDGGHGNLNGINDTSDVSGDTEGLSIASGFAGSNIYVLPGESNYSDVSGDTQTFTRKGRYLTIWYSRFNTGGRFTYELDSSGTEIPIDPALPTTGGVHTFAKSYIDMGSVGTHTITIRNKGGRLVSAPAYSGGSFTGSGTGGTLATNTYDYAAAFLTTGGTIGALGAVKTATITLGQSFTFVVPAQPEGGVTTNIYRRVSGVGNYKLIGSVATNSGSAYLFTDSGSAAGIDYAASTPPVLESTSKWVNVATVVTKANGIVLNNFAARGSGSGMAANAYNLAVGVGLDLEPSTATPALSRAVDATAGSIHPKLVLLTHGINDQQASPSDNSATLQANTQTAIQTAHYAGADVLVCIPAFEAAANQSNAPLYRAALKAAAVAESTAWIDIGMGGALPTLIAGITTNPHLTQAQYTTQGDFIYGVLGAR